uniref:H(+)-exporting diphosphatase n=1 Tax=Chromera velia CCMP2878 TaxID=1169474 RepID=A0A0G4FHJ9_9ALVE|eukprot:Cvel_16979.t1-p1 / transcript=Cvel_16979.t1 / gene=Cvel_16979 / organism=Chromera_velia_CCMP2878 / gene_product=hypothetical protein / transcript_product=hypothetical protein / location=Cvel_scaffold1333:28088-33026(+) / protein_length=594 / sequence_SO=supercontig / SO=protein_coding / is_pseudo=false
MLAVACCRSRPLFVGLILSLSFVAHGNGAGNLPSLSVSRRTTGCTETASLSRGGRGGGRGDVRDAARCSAAFLFSSPARKRRRARIGSGWGEEGRRGLSSLSAEVLTANSSLTFAGSTAILSSSSSSSSPSTSMLSDSDDRGFVLPDIKMPFNFRWGLELEGTEGVRQFLDDLFEWFERQVFPPSDQSKAMYGRSASRESFVPTDTDPNRMIPVIGLVMTVLSVLFYFTPIATPSLIQAVAPTASAITAAAAATAESQAREDVARCKSFSARAAVAAARAEAAAARADAAASQAPAFAAWSAAGAVLCGALEYGTIWAPFRVLVWLGAIVSTSMAAGSGIYAATAEEEATIALARRIEEEQRSTQRTVEMTGKQLLRVVAPSCIAFFTAKGRSRFAIAAVVAAAQAAQAAARAERFAAAAARAAAAKSIRAARSEVEVSKAEASAAVAPFGSAAAAVAPPLATVLSYTQPFAAACTPLLGTVFGFVSLGAAVKTREEAGIAQEVALEDVYSARYAKLKPVGIGSLTDVLTNVAKRVGLNESPKGKERGEPGGGGVKLQQQQKEKLGKQSGKKGSTEEGKNSPPSLTRTPAKDSR